MCNITKLCRSVVIAAAVCLSCLFMFFGCQGKPVPPVAPGFAELHKELKGGLMKDFHSVKILTVKGNWYEMGRQITYDYGFAKDIYDDGLSLRKMLDEKRVDQYYKDIEKYLDEDMKEYFKGMAEGIKEKLNCLYEEAMNAVVVWNICFDLFSMMRCTAFALADAGGNSWLVHNTDLTTGGGGYVIIYIPDNSYAYASYFGPAFAGVSLGMNEQNLAITYNACAQTGRKPGLPALLMAQRVMKGVSSVDGAAKLFQEWVKNGNTFGASPALFLVADFKTNEVARIEVSSDEVAIVRGEKDRNGNTRVLTANHFLAMPHRCPGVPPSSAARLERLTQLLDNLKDTRIETFACIMADHNGENTGKGSTICVHAEPADKPKGPAINTQFLNIFDGKGNIYWAVGNPCRWLDEHKFIPYVNWVEFAAGKVEESCGVLPVVPRAEVQEK